MASFGGLILSRDPGEHLALASLGGLFLSSKHLILGTQGLSIAASWTATARSSGARKSCNVFRTSSTTLIADSLYRGSTAAFSQNFSSNLVFEGTEQ